MDNDPRQTKLAGAGHGSPGGAIEAASVFCCLGDDRDSQAPGPASDTFVGGNDRSAEACVLGYLYGVSGHRFAQPTPSLSIEHGGESRLGDPEGFDWDGDERMHEPTVVGSTD